MTKSIVMDKYPVLSINIMKEDSPFSGVDQFIAYFKEKVDSDPIATYIAVFNHYEHTSSLENGEMAEGIVDAKNIIFCFGQKIPNPLILSVRPRSIAVVEDKSGFTISFMEAPMAPMSAKMESWVDTLKK